jgi:hypothetical protein
MALAAGASLTLRIDAQNARHAFEAFELTEGREERAEKISHFNDDGVIDKQEAKEIKKAKERELHTRHRGTRQFSAVRTAVWVRPMRSSPTARLPSCRVRTGSRAASRSSPVSTRRRGSRWWRLRLKGGRTLCLLRRSIHMYSTRWDVVTTKPDTDQPLLTERTRCVNAR